MQNIITCIILKVNKDIKRRYTAEIKDTTEYYMHDYVILMLKENC